MTISEALTEMINYFKTAGVESPELDAQVILAFVLNTEKYKLLIDNQKKLTKKNIEKLKNTIERRINGEPVAYITCKKEFYSLDFKVTKDVLIPRPETEQLVDLAIYYAAEGNKVLDIGTGSGAIAIALKKNRPDLCLYACDISNKSLKVAEENALIILGKDSIIFSKSDLFSAYKRKKFNLILSNPPYLNINQKDTLKKDIFFEPGHALFAGDDGKEILKKIIIEADEYLYGHGFLLLEIGYDQDDYIREISYNKYLVNILKDYSGLPRIAVLQKYG